MYKHSSTQLLRDASSKITCEQSAPVEPKIDWDEADYCDTVMKLEPEKTTPEVTVPGVNKAHKNPCRNPGADGQCTGLCSILKKIYQKQEERKFKKLKLSLKYRRH